MVPADTPNGTPVFNPTAPATDANQRVYIGADPDDSERFFMRVTNTSDTTVCHSVKREDFNILPKVSKIRSVGYHLYSDGSGSIDVFVEMEGVRGDNVVPFKASLNRDGTWGRFDFRDRELREANPQAAVIDADVRGSLVAHERFGPLAKFLGLVSHG